jgi:cyclic pyranopterin phosphate synthase
MDDVVSAREIVETIGREVPLEPVEAHYRGEVAERWRYADGSGEIGVIASVTQAFCRDCTRARVSTEGQLFTCLFATGGHDLRALLRGVASDSQIEDSIRAVWQRRSDRYSELRSLHAPQAKKIEMSYIGG